MLLSALFIVIDTVIFILLLVFPRARAAVGGTPIPHREIEHETILISGIETTTGLVLARTWRERGFRIVGVDVVDPYLPIRPGGGMSKSVAAYYQVSKDRYVSQILDIVLREEVAIWIPCSPKCSPAEDAAVKQVVESRTACKSITFDPEMTALLSDKQSFREFLLSKHIPVPRHYQVNSRDSVHRILNGAPTKSYIIREIGPRAKRRGITLPGRTLSSTYTTVSELSISKDSPWTMDQQTRLGVLWADFLVIRGRVFSYHLWTEERWAYHQKALHLHQALASRALRIIQQMTSQEGERMTGHLSVKFLVDEEIEPTSVRYLLYVSDCVSGARAAEKIVRHTQWPTEGYLAVLRPVLVLEGPITQSDSRDPWIFGAQSLDVLAEWCLTCILRAHDDQERFQERFQIEIGPYLFWKNTDLSAEDPLPWWWDLHVYRPLCELWTLAKQVRTLIGRRVSSIDAIVTRS
ncbi:hypothetical protein N7539_000194 [Penicillium diatomitis]|uniref:Uncharacterized protein n=1 Tax=Penicillium diatomitis TaxID=2819901 RepID=A0A9W9XLA1_9EURO|nr:uncharacterized protein N7539_000194 [Penicillium diatomitis]KAJ5495078.1 hypothetical protein N7539_000194 [Penicillium diatomitis]